MQPTVRRVHSRHQSLLAVLVGSVIALSTVVETSAERETVTNRPSAAAVERVWIVTQRPLSSEQVEVLRGLDRLLIMIPGVSSGDLHTNCQFLDRIRMQGGYEVAVFYDWESGNLSRKAVSPTATAPAAARLVELCETFQDGAGRPKPIDLLAHSAGTVIVNKAATKIVTASSSIRFRHVLFLGTALAANESLDDLKSASTGVLNVHSAYDKVNRNVNDRIGKLSALDGAAYWNLRMDHSMSGRIMRHYVFLASNPENWVQCATYLTQGRCPEPKPLTVGQTNSIDLLHGLCLWVQAHPNQSHEEIRPFISELLAHPNPEVQYYGVILTGQLRVVELAPMMKTILEGENSPVYLRKEIYQALGNLEDGRQARFLQRARDLDPACAEEIRDVLRALKTKRIEPIR